MDHSIKPFSCVDTTLIACTGHKELTLVKFQIMSEYKRIKNRLYYFQRFNNLTRRPAFNVKLVIPVKTNSPYRVAVYANLLAFTDAVAVIIK